MSITAIVPTTVITESLGDIDWEYDIDLTDAQREAISTITADEAAEAIEEAGEEYEDALVEITSDIRTRAILALLAKRGITFE